LPQIVPEQKFEQVRHLFTAVDADLHASVCGSGSESVDRERVL
jgi:hypothetical protein